MKVHIIKYIILVISLIILNTAVMAEVGFSGDISAVSTYVWRGIKINSGPAIQSTAEGSYGILTFGFWGSSISVGDNTEVETDLYASVALPTGDLSTSLGATVYMLDFRQFNSTADAEVELFANLGYSAFGLNIFYIPEQNSIKDNPNSSLYWTELSGTAPLLGADLSALIGYGTYSSRWMPDGPTKDPVALMVISASKSVSEATSIYWAYSFNIDGGFERIFYFGGSYSF
jgi:uncharacterized protein (TIGR02001 family)